MLLPKFDYSAPETIEDACGVLEEYGSGAKVIAGGTDLIVNMKKKVLFPTHVVSLSRIAELKEVTSANGTVRIGACVTAGEICRSQAIVNHFSALAKGAGSLGTPLVRNLATIGGNTVTARPAADIPPALLAYDARVCLKKKKEDREVRLEAFFKGPGETIISEDEILTAFVLKKPPRGSGAGYMKFGVRETHEISLVNAAAQITVELSDGTIRTARIFLGSVGPMPIRASSAEAVVVGEKPSEKLFSRAGEAAAADCRPIDDFRASAVYKRAMAAVLTRRVLEKACGQALGIEGGERG